MKIIHVNGMNIALNLKDGAERAVYDVTDGITNLALSNFVICGTAKLNYKADRSPTTWVETDSNIEIGHTEVGDKIIHVNRQHILMNKKDGRDRPVFTVKHKGIVRYARSIVIHGHSSFVYSGEQLSCGARAWISTSADLTMQDEMTFREARS